MSSFIRFINERSFIQVRNLRTGVVVFLNKSPLLIQRDSDVSLLLKNDSYVGYYKYSDVQYPSLPNIDELIRTLVMWVEDDVGEIDKTATTLVDIRTNYRSSAFDVTELTQNNATSSYDAEKSMTEMTVTTDAGTRIVRSSREYIPATFVSEVIVVMQAQLSAGGTSPDNVTSRVGVFEDASDLTINPTNNGRGVFFEYEFSSNTISAVLRQNQSGSQTDIKVIPANWNIDPFDGNGPSEFNLDPTKINIFVFEWDPVKKLLRLGVLVSDIVYYCHEFGRTETITKLNTPVRWEITQTDPASADAPSAGASMFQGKASVFYANDPTISTRSIDVGLGKKTINLAADTVPMFSLRLKENSNRAKLSPKMLTILNTAAGGIAKWELVLNCEFPNADTNFADIPDSFARFSTEETRATGGKVTASGFIIDSGVFVIDLEKNGIYITSNIAGVPDTLTLRLTNISGVVEILSGIDWYERE